jgi:uncharacterized protein (DUF58 family)
MKRTPTKEGAAGTAAPLRLLTPEVEASVAGLRFHFTSSMDGKLTGVHRSAQPGVSVEFSEHKEYSPGDDVRHLNWKVFARSDKFYVRQFTKDTHANVHLIFDCSGSMHYRSAFSADSKASFAARLGMILSFLFLRQNDAVGLMTVRGQKMLTVIPPRSHASQLVTIEQVLARTLAGERAPEHAEGTTSLEEGLEYLVRAKVTRNAIILLSDFFLEEEQLFPYLVYLKSGGNFLWLIQVLDPAELDLRGPPQERTFPFEGTMAFRSNETGHSVLMDARLARADYVHRFHSFLDHLQDRCAEAGLELSRCNTDVPPASFVLEYLLGRR